MSRLHFLLLFVGLIVLSAEDISFDCIQTVSHHDQKRIINGTYDLCDFVVGPNTKDGLYTAYDNRTVGNIEEGMGDAVNYTFYFNIASNIAKLTPDPECDNYNATWRQSNGLETGYCKTIISEGLRNATCKDADIVAINSMTAAYQAKKGSDDGKCWRLHDGVTPPIWTFIDPRDPAMGLQVTYSNGDWCPAFGKNRDFTMKFICNGDTQTMPDYEATIFETIGAECSYEFKMETYRGCPTECTVDNEALCSGNGVCDYDWMRGAPKCFCYLGWYGTDCHETADPNQEIIYEDSDNSYVGALVVVILLLLVILFILGYLFLRYTRIKNQPFDFKFLQQTKQKRAKKQKVGSDEYSDE